MVDKYKYEYSKISKQWTVSHTQQVISSKTILNAEAFNYYQCLPISQQEQLEKQKLQLLIQAMETSKLWKIRVAWFRLKQILGLAVDDWWTKERGTNYQFQVQSTRLLPFKIPNLLWK